MPFSKSPMYRGARLTSFIFARRPLARFMLPINERWQMNFGLEQPESEVDTSIDPNAASVNHAPARVSATSSTNVVAPSGAS